MEAESESVSLSNFKVEHEDLVLSKLHSKTKKIFKIIKPKIRKLVQYKIYNRKEKSLEELSRKFINCLIDEKEKIICLDQITLQLGVERRRIYDIINILESLQVVKRKCKNNYVWKGFNTIYETIQLYAQNQVSVNTRKKREKSLEVLSSGFIKLFLERKPVWTLEEAAKHLGGNDADQNRLKTKVRRLYDIANVLKSIGLIQKTHLDSKKPAFKWVGCAGLRQSKTAAVKIEEVQQRPLQSEKPFGLDPLMERCLDFFLHQRQLDEKNLVTEQKVRQQITQTTQITPKLIKKKLLTIIPPRFTTPKKYTTTPKKNQETTPNKCVVALMGKFNQNV